MSQNLPQKIDHSLATNIKEQLKTTPALTTLASLSFEQLDENYTPLTPHEAMAIELVKKAMDGDNTAMKIYWDMQKQILQLVGKNNSSGVQFNIKRNDALSIALDNIQAKIIDNKVLDEKE